MWDGRDDELVSTRLLQGKLSSKPILQLRLRAYHKTLKKVEAGLSGGIYGVAALVYYCCIL